MTTYIVTDTNEVNDMLFVENCPEYSFNYDFENELPSHWLTWTVYKSGTLTFELSMDEDLYDLDFVIYKSEKPELICDSLIPIRCMFSGFTVGGDGQIIPDLPCYQSTGLSFSETDLSEDSGSPDGQNGYVRYLDVTEGETYVVIILNFSGLEEELITIDFCGTALLGQDDFVCNQPVNTEDEAKEEILVSPNPVTDFIRLNNFSPSNNGFTNLNIINMYGSIYKVQSISATEFIGDVSHLSRGIYILMQEENAVPKFVKFFKL